MFRPKRNKYNGHEGHLLVKRMLAKDAVKMYDVLFKFKHEFRVSYFKAVRRAKKGKKLNARELRGIKFVFKEWVR